MPEPNFRIDQEQPHLGGYIVGGDDATYYPELWTWLVKECSVSSMIDVGCGEGYACGYFVSLGCEATGIDGINMVDSWEHEASFITHDYSKGKLGLSNMDFEVDLCWSCEFVEHVEEKYMPNYLETFACAHLVLMTHAEPGQPGHHHVNCKPAAYWIGAMAAIGYTQDEHLTDITRTLAKANVVPWNHYARSGLAFVRN
jgi:hypothetical protein